MLPTLDRDGTALARWRPVVQGIDRVTAGHPGRGDAAGRAGRAERPDARLSTPHRRPTRSCWSSDALDALTDAAVRDRLAAAAEPIALLPPRRGRAPARPPAAEAWLAALLTPDARVGGAAGVARRELDALADAVAAWDEVGTADTGEGRANFRLAEIRTLHDPADPGPDPDDQTGDGTRFVLEFFLQSAAPTRACWCRPGRSGTATPTRLLAAAPGAAARRAGPGRDGVAAAGARRCGRPARRPLELELGGADEFLTAGAPLLVEAGFGVQLPAGWDGSRRVGLTLSARSTPADRVLTRSGLSRETLADFRWALAVGDEELSEEELAELVAAKAPLVRVRGRWVSVDAQRLAAGLEFLRRAEPAPERPERGRGAGAGPPAPARLGRRGRGPGDPAAGHRGPRRGLDR